MALAGFIALFLLGEYYANVSFDDVNCNNFITNATFSVLKADNYVSVSFDNVFEGDKVTVIINASADGVYLLDVNGSLVNVTVAGGIGSVELSLSGDEYYANVTFDNENYNSYISNATWFKPNDVIIPPVLSDDGFGNIVLDLPEGSRGNLTVYVNHDQLASIKVYGGENIIPLHVSNYGENVVTVVFIDDAGFAYELSKTVYVKKPVEPFDIEFSNDSSILGFTAYMPEDVTGVLNVYVADNFYDVDIVDGKADFSISGLPNRFYVVNIEYLGDDNYEGFSQGFFVEIEQGDIDYDPGTIAVEHTGAGDSADIQAAIDKVNPGDVILLGNYDYVDVADVNITKPVIIEGNGRASITSSGDGTPIFNLPPISDGGPESLNIHGVVFKLSNGDTVVKAIADNDTDPLSIVTPSIKINGNSFELVNDTTVPESVTILELDSERGVLSPTEEISISGNTIAAGVKPFEFEIISVETGGDVNVGPQNITSNRKATVIVFENMNTTAVSQADGGKTGEYFIWRLTDADGNPLANTPMEIGFNGVVYNYEKDGIITDDDGYAKLQINLGYKGVYTFAICFLGNDEYNASFVVAKITVDTQKASLTVPNKSYAASTKTKTLTATFKTAKGNPIADKWITFTLNGKTYKGKTNAKGVASVNVSLNKKGTYSFVAKFAGDSTYAPINKTGKLTIK